MSNRAAVRASLLLLLLLTTLPPWCRLVEANSTSGGGGQDTKKDDGLAHYSHGGTDEGAGGQRDSTSTSSDVLGRAAVAGGAAGLIWGGPAHGILSGLGTAYATALDPRISGAYWAGFLAASMVSSRTAVRVILGVAAAASSGADGIAGDLARASSGMIIAAFDGAAELDAKYDLSYRFKVFLRRHLWKLKRDYPGCDQFLHAILGVAAAASSGADGIAGDLARASSGMIIAAFDGAAELDAKYDLSYRFKVFLRRHLWKLKRDYPGCDQFLHAIGDWKDVALMAAELVMNVERMHDVSGKLGEFFTVDHEWWEERGFHTLWEESRVYAYLYK